MTPEPLSIVTPAFNEAQNLPVFYERLRAALPAGTPWEWIVVDDHSRDSTFDVVRDLSRRDSRVRGIRLARNTGSHITILCGLAEARGSAAAVLAADLQDPPETLPALIARWQDGAQVVWAARRRGAGARWETPFARFYYWMMRHVLGMRDMPAHGADFFLIDRAVIDALGGFRERHVSVLALITWLGFRQERVEYDKQPRLHGASGWTLRRKVKLVVDSVTAFSDVPIVVCWVLGAIALLAGIALAGGGVAGLGAGVLEPPHLVVVGAVFGALGIALVMLAVIGEYVWRALDEARQRPRYVVEARTTDAVDRTAAYP